MSINYGQEKHAKAASKLSYDETNNEVDIASKVAVTGNVSSSGLVLAKNVVPSLHGLAIATVATAGTLTYANNTITINDFDGGAAQAVTLPAATQGSIVVHMQTDDTTSGGVNTLSFDCAGSDAYETGSVVESRNSNVVVYDTSTAGETLLTYTPAAAATNYISQGSQFIFWCVTDGLWFVHLNAKSNPASTGLTGACLFGA
jgi:hypothetical protein